MTVQDLLHLRPAAGDETRSLVRKGGSAVNMSQRDLDLASIASVPPALLNGLPREALVKLVELGMHVYCFEALGADPDEDQWRLWLEPLAQRLPGHNGRVHLDNWLVDWASYYRMFTTVGD